MDISTVSSAASAVSAYKPPAASTQPGKRSEEVQQAQRLARQDGTEPQKVADTQADAKPDIPPKPVVNGQGQTTGRILNVTA